jgi:hypothetical protein
MFSLAGILPSYPVINGKAGSGDKILSSTNVSRGLQKTSSIKFRKN